ncbi:glycosyl hydrolase 115 family protein [Salipaludibacillus sp. HK11]|uniref:glycosyl hydrolase 115 family protein n=1 Tax=Salipaludibacillus sp. HK11 TaxID=3394320 RepID=UPI0039FC22FA
MYFNLTSKVKIEVPENLSLPVKHGLNIFSRDMTAVFGTKPTFAGNHPTGTVLRLSYSTESNSLQRPEAFKIIFQEENDQMVLLIQGDDDLGLIYGLLHLSEKYLQIDPFWYWADLPIEKKKEILIEMKEYTSPKRQVTYRGWFVNDEVCLIGWEENYPPSADVWYPVFEALLRCGGNMIIPGTDLPRDGIHHQLATEMGLWVTHHHAEPLGAEMFLRAYPDEKPSYTINPHLFEKLWVDAIEKQKDEKIVWTLSYRGQGDTPFWSFDPTFQTNEKRGQHISEVVQRQYDLVKERVKEPVFCLALYGEIAELYKSGWIRVPEDVIKVWADNGYGKMVSRRQENLNERVPCLPDGDDPSPQGIYYHVTFHDLQASNHLTMTTLSAEAIANELHQVNEGGGSELWLINSGNIRQHLYPLDLIRVMWSDGEINIIEHRNNFLQRMFAEDARKIAPLYEAYSESSIAFGNHEDEKSGEQFYHHPARRIIGHWLARKEQLPIKKLYWLTDEVSFDEQILIIRNMLTNGLEKWVSLKRKALDIKQGLSNENQVKFHDQLLCSIVLHESGCRGFLLLLDGYQLSRSEKFPEAFVYVTEAHRAYMEGLEALKESEHGKWSHFYRADWLTNVESTINNVDVLRSYLRMHGDSPNFFQWYKEFIMSDSEKHIYLENTHRRVRSNDELSDLLKTEFYGVSKFNQLERS